MRTRDKIATDAVAEIARIPAGSTLVIGGAGGVQAPDKLVRLLVQAFRETGGPSGLTEIHPFRTGEREGFGTSLLDPPGLISCMIGASFWPIGTPPLIRRILDNEMRAYNLPVGPLFGMLEAGASSSPGVITEIGLGTFVDPRCGGGALNSSSTSPLVTLIELDGREYLFYRALRPDVAFIRGTVADEDGNVATFEEPTVIAPLLLAQAAKSSGGKVFVQVREVVPAGSLDPRCVRIPGYLVDHVVVDPEQQQTPSSVYDPTLVGAEPVRLDEVPVVDLSPSKVLQRRAIMEAKPGDVVAIGFGLPGNLPNVAVEEGVFDQITFTIEHGAIGGVNPYAFGSRTFPASHGPSAIVDSLDQVRAYAGGTVDMAYLGVGEIDSAGNVNVSRFGDRIPGCGGFVDITQGIDKIVFCAKVGEHGKRKFVAEVQQRTMSAEVARARGQEIVYVTELGVFRLGEHGLELFEIAPDVTVDELRERLGATFDVASDLAETPKQCYAIGTMGLAEEWAQR